VALVDDAARRAHARQCEASGHEVGVAEVVTGGGQAADVDLGGRAKQDAAGVEEEDLSGGVDFAEDLAGFAALYAVEGGGAGAGLVEVDGGVVAEVEGAPVDGGARAGLVDVEGDGAVGALDGGGDAGFPGGDLPVGREGGGADRGGCGGGRGNWRGGAIGGGAAGKKR